MTNDQIPLLDSLPPDILDEVDFFIREYGAGVSLAEYISVKQDKYFSTLLPKIRNVNPDWSEDQVVAGAVRHLLAGEELLWRGIAKRLADDDAAELARSVSLYARLELWDGTRDECGDFLNFSQDMLRAMAAGDGFVIQRFAAVAPNYSEQGPWDARVLHNGVIAAINRDEEHLAKAIDDFSRWEKPPKYLSCLYTALNGLLKKDKTLVHAGICSFFKVSGKLHQDDTILKVISLEAHGIYELCRWFDPELTVSFDRTQGLPWDRQLCDWVAEMTDEQPFHDVSALSPALQQWLVDLPISDGLRHDWQSEHRC